MLASTTTRQRAARCVAGTVSFNQHGDFIIRNETSGLATPPTPRQESPDIPGEEMQPHGVLQQIRAVPE